MSMEYLFKPLKIGNMELKSRTGLAPMATGLDTNGEFSQRSLDFYEERAKGGVGFITVGVVTVDKKARYRVDTEGTKDQKNPGAWDDKFIPTWTKLADTVHKHGTKLIPQLFHPGNLDPTVPIAPSYVPLPTRDPSRTIIPKELSIDDIKQIEKDFADAAYRMKVAGCDGIQFHMSHGAYGLVAAFASPFLNKRTDEYGGNLEGRMRFPVECIREIRTKVGRNFPIIIRLSGEELVPGGRTIIETAYIANMLEKEGVDAIEVSAGTVPDSIYRVVPAIGTPLALNSDYSEAIKKVVNIPVLVVGNIKSPQAAEYLIETGKADGVVVGRGFLADPAWPNKAAAGKFDDIAYCSGCGACTKVGGTGRPITCVMNPACANERAMQIIPAAKPKKVLIAGGGPSGLEAARVAALRGHDVTVVEKAQKLGGQLNIACMPPNKQSITQITQYLLVQMKKAGAKVVLNQEVTPEYVKEFNPDVVIVATGGTPVIPNNIKGIDKNHVVTAWDVLSGKKAIGSNVIVVGGGEVGCETADYIARNFMPFTKGRVFVTIVEMLEYIGTDMDDPVRRNMVNRLYEKKIEAITSAKVTEILDDAIIVNKNGKDEKIEYIDSVVLAVGTKPSNDLINELKGLVPEIYAIGDADKFGNALDATLAGTETARKI